jgi:hypothetical protein
VNVCSLTVLLSKFFFYVGFKEKVVEVGEESAYSRGHTFAICSSFCLHYVGLAYVRYTLCELRVSWKYFCLLSFRTQAVGRVQLRTNVRVRYADFFFSSS